MTDKPNPYESPQSEPRPKVPPGYIDVEAVNRTNKTATVVMLGCLMVPACCIAFFVVCSFTSKVLGPVPEPTSRGLLLSLATALIVRYVVIRAIRKAKKR